MKILLVSEFFPVGKDLKFSGGVEARTYYLAKYLAKNNDVSVICTRQPGTPKTENMAGIKIIRVGPVRRYNAGAEVTGVLQIVGLIHSAIQEGSKIKADITDGGNFLAHLISKEIARKNKIPVVYWYPDVFLGQWIKTSGLIAGTAGWLMEKFNLLRHPDHFIAISNVTANKLTEVGITKSKITVIPCGIDEKEFTGNVKKREPITIICISRLVRYKKIKDLILAFALLHKNHPDLNLKIIGRGPEEKNLRKLCDALKITSKVSFENNLKRRDLIERIKSASIFCLPSSVEGFGISVIEAAAAQTPYVVSDIDVFKEITKSEQGGLIFKLGNVRDLSSKLEMLLSDQALYKRKQTEGKALIKNYRWENIAKETEKIYRKTIKNYGK